VMKVTSLGAVFLTVLLLLVSSRLLQVGEGVMPRWLTIVGIVVFTGLLIHQIRQQQLRHALAKQGLIEIEKAFLFFEENAYLPGRSLYPPQWQAPPGKDRNVAISILSLLGLTAVVIAAILLA